MQPAVIRKLTAWPVPSRLRLPSSGRALRRLLIGFCPQDKVVIRTRFVPPTTMLPARATLRPVLHLEEPAAREPGSGGGGDRDRRSMVRFVARCWPRWPRACMALPNVDSGKIWLLAKATPVKLILTSSIYEMRSDDHDQTNP